MQEPPADTNSAIVVAVDRLGAGWLGPYGNSWIETPELNRFASRAVLFEEALADSPRLDRSYRSLWQGLHAMCPTGDPRGADLAGVLTEAGIRCCLVTDDPEVGSFASAGSFAERFVIDVPPPRKTARSLEQTQLARLFATAMDWLETAAEPFLLWIHARGMSGPWDAPYELRRQFADEDDPDPPDFVDPPSQILDRDHDPDQLLGLMHAYAGQVALLDACWGALVQCVESLPGASSTLLALLGLRGYPLGEHGWVGACRSALYGELLHIPWLIRLPGRHQWQLRSHWLVQPPDLHATLISWLAANTPCHSYFWRHNLLSVRQHWIEPVRDRACAMEAGQRAIRTPAWFLKCSEAGASELYAKPDDRWEANEVADRCQEIVGQLIAALDEFQQAVAGDGRPLSALPQELVDAFT